ncbi:MAG TPA: PAS domain-containing sensor histidine kinase [Syntrophorhabdaceae bacterium]|nr:PAS domain-containing sensor histidine kinase [Syntrophorhabdaceae bacterium]
MNYEDMTKDELIKELENLNQCVFQFEKSEAELRQVESALRQAEEKYRNIFENAAEGIFQTSPEGRFISANPSLAQIHGYDSPEELINSITDMANQLYVNPEDRMRLAKILHERGAVQNFEVQMYRKNRGLHWISINVKAVKDKTDKTIYYEGTMLDITQRKMTEKELKESEERYRTAIEHSNDGVAILQGNINQYVNRRFIEMFEYDRYEEITGQPITKIVHPDDFEKVTEINRRRQMGQSVPASYEFKGITKKGRAIHIEVSATSTTFRGEQVYLAYLRDVTERKIAEASLRNERNRFQTLTENAPFGIAMIDKTGNFTYINPKFVEIFGYTLRDVPNGKTWFKKAYPDNNYRKQVIATWIDDIKNVRPGEKKPRIFDVTCKDNSVITINFIPVRLLTGEHIISFENITERIQTHNALIKSHKELESLNRAKTKAVNHISHELKTPLAVIQGNIRILKRKFRDISLNFDYETLIKPIEKNLERLLDLSRETDEIFNVSRELEALVILDDLDRLWGKIEMLSDVPTDIRNHWEALKDWTNHHLSGSTQNYQPIELFPFVRSIMDKISQLSSHRNININVEGESFLFITIDPAILRDIIEGLVKNAIENTPDGGFIEITIEQKKDKIWLHVKDYGIGITEENQQYIFDGLFHTKETDLYSSKKPYDFGAGGKGLDLLRMKINGRRFGFDISCKSKRCIYIPTDQDICPGNISMCQYCTSPDDCKKSGGSVFSVSFSA